MPQIETLETLPERAPAIVCALHAPAVHPEWLQQLADIGFVPGEPVQVLRRAWPGGDPLVVRVGNATFALRCAEAACVQVLALEPGVQTA
jgi:ferrous iron transport protein A